MKPGTKGGSVLHEEVCRDGEGSAALYRESMIDMEQPGI